MRNRTWNLLLPLATLAVLAACGSDDNSGPGETRRFDWAATVADGDWAAGHAGFYFGSPVRAMSEVRLVDRRALGGTCVDLLDPTQVPGEFSYMRLRLPSLEGGTHPIVPSGEEVIFAGAQLRLVRVWDGTMAHPELEAVEGTVTITPGESRDDVTVAIDARFAVGELIGSITSDGVTTYYCADGDSRETFECHAPGCCYEGRRIPFTITLRSAYCPAFCNALGRDLEQMYCRGT